MKKLFIAVATFMVALSASAQDQMPPIPQDKAIRIGKLDNGLTYYIRHNEEPKGQANFYIAQKVGSILENEDQRGLAHFLEHMCFNGTERFPGNGLIKYCESIGVAFGADLNAYTSFDETVYNINNVPVAKVPEAIDSCLWIIHDWADGLLLTDEDIDHERGVIHEEWRQRSNAQIRMLEVILDKVFAGNRYADRMPIGLMSVVDNFPYKVLRDYYEKWYRPDQQGVIVVGDIDVDAVEGKIKDIFGPIKAVENPAEREYVQVADNDEPIIALAKDKENTNTITMISFKHDPFPDAMKGNMSYFIYEYATEAAEMMLDSRLEELVHTATPPFIGASISDDELLVAKTKNAFSGTVLTDENGILKGAAAVYREMLRATKHGFTASEYERAKAEMLAQAETRYNQREKINNDTFGRNCASNFTDGEPLISAEDYFTLIQQLAPNIPVEAVNQVISSLISDKNLVIVGMYPDKEGVTIPSDEEMLAAIKAVEGEEILPYVDKVSDKPLLSEEPVAGSVVKTTETLFGYKLYTLSNGAKVYLKTTDFNPDEIIMRASSRGGKSLYPDYEAISLKVLNDVMTLGGVGEFSNVELTKVLAGKNVSVSPSVGNFSESVSARSTPKDFETMLQLNYLYFTALRADEEAFASWKTRTEAQLRNTEADPMTAFSDTLYATVYEDDFRVSRLKTEDLENIDYNHVLSIARERFANAADFNFIITGNIDEATALPLIEKYIGSLPAGGKKEKENAEINKMKKGWNENVFQYKMETPAVTNIFIDHGDVKYSLKKDLSYQLAVHALDILLMEEIREKEGGTYGISASGSMNATPLPMVMLTISYQTSPDKYEYLNGRVRELVGLFEKNGPRAEDLEKGKKLFIKKYQDGLKKNGYFSTALQTYLEDGTNTIDGAEEMINSITIEDARKAFIELQNLHNHIEVIEVGVK